MDLREVLMLMQESGKKVVSIEFVLSALPKIQPTHHQTHKKPPYIDLNAKGDQIVYRH